MSRIYPTIYNKENFPFIQLIEGSAGGAVDYIRISQGAADDETSVNYTGGPSLGGQSHQQDIMLAHRSGKRRIEIVQKRNMLTAYQTLQKEIEGFSELRGELHQLKESGEHKTFHKVQFIKNELINMAENIDSINHNMQQQQSNQAYLIDILMNNN